MSSQNTTLPIQDKHIENEDLDYEIEILRAQYNLCASSKHRKTHSNFNKKSVELPDKKVANAS